MSGQVTILQLPTASALTGNESVPIVQNGVTVQTTTGAIAVQPTQTQTFLTVGQQSSLANSRQIAVSTGLSFTDGGAQGSYTIAVTGALASLINSGTGIQVKTGASTLTARQITVNTGLSIANSDGISGNPTISLSTLLQNFNSVSGTGLLALNGTAVSVTGVTGVGGQVSVTNGTTAPQIGLATTSVTSGTYSAPTIVVDSYGRITSATTVSYLTQITAGSGLSGGVITGSGTISLSTVGTSGTYGDYSRVPVFTTNAYGQITTVTNTSIAISANQVTSDILPIARGGTNNNATPTSGTVVYGNGSALAYTAVGTIGQVLTSQGSGAPTWTIVAGTGTVTSVSFTGGIISVATATSTPALTIAGTSGGIPYFSSASTWATSSLLALNALMVGGGSGTAPSTITTGTGVVTALGVNTGSSGAFVVNGGALGTPSSGTVTNLTGTASININGTVGATTATTGAFTTVSATGVITSTVATGTAPFTVASTTQVANLNSATSGTATNATNVALTAGSGATNYLHFSASATGNQPVNTNTSLTYNYTNNAITSGINGGTF